MGGDKHGFAPISRAGLIPHCFVGQTFESKAVVRIAKQNLLCEQLPGIDSPRISTRNLYKFHSPDLGTQKDVTKPYSSID